MSGKHMASLPTTHDLISLLAPFGISHPVILSLYQKTALAYASEGRFYHTLTHIGHVLHGMDLLIDSGDYHLASNSDLALHLAAWFHDIVYDPHRNDNEEQSATWTTLALAHFKLPALVLPKVSHLILATHSHMASPDDLPAQILLDADLSILGAPPITYARYATAIRQEYIFVPDEAYRAGRRAVLKSFLDRSKIFNTTAAVAVFEKQARANLNEEIRWLSEICSG